MAGKLSAKAQAKLRALGEAPRIWERVHSLVERFGSTTEGHEYLINPIRRASQRASRIMGNNGLPALSEKANQLASLIKRRGALETKFARMRELVGTVGIEMERAEKVIKKRDRG
jgi:hypothetical protein